MTERPTHGDGQKPQDVLQTRDAFPLFPSPVKIPNPHSTDKYTKVLGEYKCGVEIVKDSSNIFGTDRQPESATCLPGGRNVFDAAYKKEMAASGKSKKAKGSGDRKMVDRPNPSGKHPLVSATTKSHQRVHPATDGTRGSPNLSSSGRSSQTPPISRGGKPNGSSTAESKQSLVDSKSKKELSTKSSSSRVVGGGGEKQKKEKKKVLSSQHPGNASLPDRPHSSHSSHAPSPTTMASDAPSVMDKTFSVEKPKVSTEKKKERRPKSSGGVQRPVSTGGSRPESRGGSLLDSKGSLQPESRGSPVFDKPFALSENTEKSKDVSFKKSSKSSIITPFRTASSGEGEYPSASSKPPKKKIKREMAVSFTSEVKPAKSTPTGFVPSGGIQDGTIPNLPDGTAPISSISSMSPLCASLPSGTDNVLNSTVSRGMSGGVSGGVSGGILRHNFVGGKSPKLSGTAKGLRDDTSESNSSGTLPESKSRPNNLTISSKPGTVYEAISQSSSSGGIGSILEKITQGMVTPISGISTPQKKSAFTFPQYSSSGTNYPSNHPNNHPGNHPNNHPSNHSGNHPDKSLVPAFTPISEADEGPSPSDNPTRYPTRTISTLKEELDMSSCSSSEDGDSDDEEGAGEGDSHQISTPIVKEDMLSPTLRRVKSIIDKPFDLLTPIKTLQKPFQFPNQLDQAMNIIKQESPVKEEPPSVNVQVGSSLEGNPVSDSDSDSSSDEGSSSEDSDSNSESSDDELEVGEIMDTKTSIDSDAIGLVQPQSSWSVPNSATDNTEDSAQNTFTARLPKKRPQTRTDLMAKMASIGSSTSISVTSSGPVNVAMPAITTSHALSTGGGLLEGTLLAGTTLGLNSGTSPRHCNTVDNANYFSIEDLSDQESSVSDNHSDVNDSTLIQTPASPHTRPLSPTTRSAPSPNRSTITPIESATLLTRSATPPTKSATPPTRSATPPSGPLVVSISISKIKPPNMAIVEPIVFQERKRPSRSSSQEDSNPYRYSHRSNYNGDDYSHYSYSHRMHHRSRSPRWHSRSSSDWRPYYNRRHEPQTAEEHLKEARNLKHYGDKASSENRKLNFYFNSVLHFMMWAHESELANRNCAFMYGETAKLLDFILGRNGLNMLARENPIAVLCLRCQANMYFKYFEVKVKRETSLQHQKTLREFFPKMAQGCCNISPYASSSPGAPSPASMSSSSSTQGTPGRVDTACTLPNNMVTMAINHLDLFEHFYKSNECWQLSNEIIARNRENTRFFAKLDQNTGPISQYGPANVVAEWAGEGFQCLFNTR